MLHRTILIKAPVSSPSECPQATTSGALRAKHPLTLNLTHQSFLASVANWPPELLSQGLSAAGRQEALSACAKISSTGEGTKQCRG